MHVRSVCLVVSFLLLSSVTCAEENLEMLERANQLKHEGQYEAAAELYEEILAEDHGNKEALAGRDDCLIMITPLIPTQSLMIPPAYDDPEYLALLDSLNHAATPWEKRRVEIALDRFSMKYTGRVFAEDEERLEREVGRIVDKAIRTIEGGAAPQKVWFDTDSALRELQAKAHQSWKGHGPDLLPAAWEKIDRYYGEHGLPNPGQPLTLSLSPAAEVSGEGESTRLTVSLSNESTSPVLLIHFRLIGVEDGGIDYRTRRSGRLTYDGDNDIYLLDTTGEEESDNLFYPGLLMPGGSIGSELNCKPVEEIEAEARFILLDEEALQSVYFLTEHDGPTEIYRPISKADLTRYSESSSFYIEGRLAPIHAPVVLDEIHHVVRAQPFTARF